MKHLVILFFAMMQGPPTWATDKNEDLHIQEAGQFFVVKVIPGAKQTQFFVVGHKAAQLDFNKLQVKGSYFINGQEKPFTLVKSKDAFVTKEPVKGKEIKLEIKESPEKMDVIKLNLKKD